MARPRGGKRNTPDSNRGNSDGAAASGDDKENRKKLKPQKQQQQQRKEKERGVAACYPPKQSKRWIVFAPLFFFLFSVDHDILYIGTLCV